METWAYQENLGSRVTLVRRGSLEIKDLLDQRETGVSRVKRVHQGKEAPSVGWGCQENRETQDLKDNQEITETRVFQECSVCLDQRAHLVTSARQEFKDQEVHVVWRAWRASWVPSASWAPAVTPDPRVTKEVGGRRGCKDQRGLQVHVDHEDHQVLPVLPSYWKTNLLALLLNSSLILIPH